jgi:hypothetical protein
MRESAQDIIRALGSWPSLESLANNSPLSGKVVVSKLNTRPISSFIGLRLSLPKKYLRPEGGSAAEYEDI